MVLYQDQFNRNNSRTVGTEHQILLYPFCALSLTWHNLVSQNILHWEQSVWLIKQQSLTIVGSFPGNSIFGQLFLKVGIKGQTCLYHCWNSKFLKFSCRAMSFRQFLSFWYEKTTVWKRVVWLVLMLAGLHTSSHYIMASIWGTASCYSCHNKPENNED